jgi:hypothetical protein
MHALSSRAQLNLFFHSSSTSVLARHRIHGTSHLTRAQPCYGGHSVIFGRAIKNEYLALGTLFATGAATFASMGGSKQAASKPSTIEQVKEAVKLNAGSRCVFI